MQTNHSWLKISDYSGISEKPFGLATALKQNAENF